MHLNCLEAHILTPHPGLGLSCLKQEPSPAPLVSSVTIATMLLQMLSRFSRVRLCVTPHRRQPTRLPRPWDSTSKNTGVGCHFLLQCMKWKVIVKSLSRVRLLATPWTAVYPAPPSMGFSRQEYWSGLPLPWPHFNSSSQSDSSSSPSAPSTLIQSHSHFLPV